MNLNKTIAVLITCHNRKEKTIQCLKALYSQKDLGESYSMEVFLVDDGCTDGTTEAIMLDFPQVTIIQGNGNLFWNRGMHLAWETASNFKDFNYYLWLNDDTFLYEFALLSILDAANKTKDQSAICGSTFSMENQKISYGGNSANDGLLIPNGNLQEAFSFNGNVVLIPKFVFSKVGNLDKSFPHAIGDFDYALRIRRAKLKSFIVGEYVGTCEGSEKLPVWCSPIAPLKKRISSLYSPLGNSHPYYYFIFELRHYGIIVSLKHFMTIHLRLFFPKLWVNK
jgi:GT2 family glycosyltransferase